MINSIHTVDNGRDMGVTFHRSSNTYTTFMPSKFLNNAILVYFIICLKERNPKINFSIIFDVR